MRYSFYVFDGIEIQIILDVSRFQILKEGFQHSQPVISCQTAVLFFRHQPFQPAFHVLPTEACLIKIAACHILDALQVLKKLVDSTFI